MIRQSQFLLIACFTLLSAPHVVAQDNNPFGPANFGEKSAPIQQADKQDSKSVADDEAATKEAERIEQINRERTEALKDLRIAMQKRLAADEEQIEAFLKKLRPQIPEETYEQIKREMWKLFEQRSASEQVGLMHHQQVLELNWHLEETKGWYDQEIAKHHESSLAIRQQLSQEIDELKGRDFDSWQQTTSMKETVVEIQNWFAHALESVDNPDLQKWVLARLKSAPETTQYLLGRHSADEAAAHDNDPIFLEPENRLEEALEKLVQQPTTPLGQTANEILRFSGRSLSRHYILPIFSTSRWPIVAESGRNREQELLNKIDECIDVAFYEIAAADFSEYVQDMYEIPVIVDSHARALIESRENELLIDFQASEVSLRAAMHQSLQQHGLTYQVRDESVVITTIQQATENPVRRVYPLWDELSEEEIENLVTAVRDAIVSPDLKIIRVDNRLVAVGSEHEQFEISKLLTLLYLSE
jgi:hypothetical protein